MRDDFLCPAKSGLPQPVMLLAAKNKEFVRFSKTFYERGKVALHNLATALI
jgi:hypothetical protein